MPRTLNDIVPPSKRRSMGMDAMPVNTPPVSRPPAAPMRPRRGFPYGTALIALIVVAGSIAALFIFSGAKVEITPKTFTASIASEFTATPASGDLPYEVITVEKTATKSVKAESTVQANDPAQGTITVMNAQGTPQALVTNTRFESPDGLVFRIHTSITVPAGSPEAPGTKDVTVYADQGGDKYNIAPTTFTLPGLKGGKSYTLVTAKSASAMAGGFSGTRPSVGDATRQAQSGPLQTALTDELTKALTAQVKEGYILIPSAITTSFNSQPDTAGDKGSVVISLKGTASAVIFPNGALAKAIATKVVPMYAGEPVSISNPAGLTLSTSASSTPSGNQPYSFSLSGDSLLVWNVDTAKIAGAVAGKRRDSAQAILLSFPEIDKALLQLHPFFASSYPSDPAKITVEVVDPSKKSK